MRPGTSHKGSICHSRLAVSPTHTNVIWRATKVNHLQGRIADTELYLIDQPAKFRNNQKSKVWTKNPFIFIIIENQKSRRLINCGPKSSLSPEFLARAEFQPAKSLNRSQVKWFNQTGNILRYKFFYYSINNIYNLI